MLLSSMLALTILDLPVRVRGGGLGPGRGRDTNAPAGKPARATQFGTRTSDADTGRHGTTTTDDGHWKAHSTDSPLGDGQPAKYPTHAAAASMADSHGPSCSVRSGWRPRGPGREAGHCVATRSTGRASDQSRSGSQSAWRMSAMVVTSSRL